MYYATKDCSVRYTKSSVSSTLVNLVVATLTPQVLNGELHISASRFSVLIRSKISTCRMACWAVWQQLQQLQQQPFSCTAF
jgi:hypothetical protein